MAQLVPVGSLNWDASSSADVVGYYVYYNATGPVDYNSSKVNAGLVTTITLPLAGQPATEATVAYGVAPYDTIGNIGDITVVNVVVDTIAPAAVTNLVYTPA